MNIFASDTDPVKSAQALDDKRVVKMCLESAQILSSALHKLGYGRSNIYKPTHVNHPCVKWAARSKGNFHWLVLHGLALNEEYKTRFFKIYSHKSTSVILSCAEIIKGVPLDELGMTPFVALVDVTGNISVIKKYRIYLNQTKWKNSNPKWTKRGPPTWYSPSK